MMKRSWRKESMRRTELCGEEVRQLQVKVESRVARTVLVCSVWEKWAGIERVPIGRYSRG